MLYAAEAVVMSFALMMLLMPVCIKKLRALKFGQTMYELGPQSHLNKKGTPNMGGVVTGPVTVMITVLVVCLMRKKGAAVPFWSLQNTLWALLFVAIGSMAVGFTDDYIKDVKKNHEGLKPKQKIAGQLIVGLLFSVWAYFTLGSEVILPFTHSTWNLGVFYIPLLTLTVLFMTNSANLQDGIDGILSSVTAVGMIAFGAMGLLMASAGSSLLNAGECSAAVAFALTGACLGFLKFNRHPAKIFMGDTGSMFIGGVMVGIAVLLRLEFLLLLICFTCVMSSVSVIMQRTYYKLTHGKRIFKMTPIHHHFEMSGMNENQIVMMYAAVTLVLSVIAVLSVLTWF